MALRSVRAAMHAISPLGKQDRGEGCSGEGSGLGETLATAWGVDGAKTLKASKVPPT